MTNGGREPITLPDWMPSAAGVWARWIEAECLSTDHRAILLRLATDPRMRGVWNELGKRNRSGDGFFHPAKCNTPLMQNEALTKTLGKLIQDEAQARAMGELFLFAFCAARNKVSVSKPSDAEPLRNLCEQRARILREVAHDLDAINSADPRVFADAATLRRVAAWQDHAVEAMRPLTDPLTIQKDRGDRVVRGTQTVIGAKLLELFGKRLDGTAATLAAVGLDQKTSARVTRSALARRPHRAKN